MSLAVAYNKIFTVLLFKSSITDENTILTVILFLLGLDFIDTIYSEVRSSVALIIGTCTSLLSFPRTVTYWFS